MKITGGCLLMLLQKFDLVIDLQKHYFLSNCTITKQEYFQKPRAYLWLKNKMNKAKTMFNVLCFLTKILSLDIAGL